MSLHGSFDRTKLFSELGNLDDWGSGPVTPASKRQTALRNLTGDANFTIAQLVALSNVTPGAAAASKAVVLDANKDVATLRNVTAGVYRSSLAGSPLVDSTAGAKTYAAADVLSGLIVRDPNGAGRTDTFPTAALLVAAIPGAAVGDKIRCKIVNNADAAETITLQAGSGGSFGATQKTHTIAQNASLEVVIRLTNVTASSEAYVIYD